MEEKKFMMEAIREAEKGMQAGDGGPFGCVIVKNGVIVGRGHNKVTSSNDPTAHAEVVAIREACQQLSDFQLNDCEIYTSCEPCPMCLGAIYWSRPKAVYFGCTRADAAAIDFDDDFIYEQIGLSPDARSLPMKNFMREECLHVFRQWTNSSNKKMY